MNTANLQIEGVLLAMATLVRQLDQKGLLASGDLEAALQETERSALVSGDRSSLPQANRDAILFPLRFLRAAIRDEGGSHGFTATAREVGMNKSRLPEEG